MRASLLSVPPRPASASGAARAQAARALGRKPGPEGSLGKLAASDQPAFADAFLAYLVSDAAQNVIPTTNWMYPANPLAAGLPKGFETLVQPEKSLLLSQDEAGALRDAAVAEWQAALAK
mgnify:CR=1 FL=1